MYLLKYGFLVVQDFSGKEGYKCMLWGRKASWIIIVIANKVCSSFLFFSGINLVVTKYTCRGQVLKYFVNCITQIN